MANCVELLAPAGSQAALVAAVQNGCDAVYLGGSAFGARAFAENFSEEVMQDAIRYAHGYGVKVYVTVNTLMKETEIETCLTYIKQLQAMDVDAIIIQDLGLLDVVHQTYPDLELHASTQMHIHNEAGLRFLKAMGIQRAVLARETTIEQIQVLSKVGIELEVFVHGAMCVSYSGQCVMSYRMFDRSGNRGACAQPCRMAYQLYRKDQNKDVQLPLEDEYLLSLKDMNTLAHIPELMEAGIHSFKIEGRMKSPEYVAKTVQAYRNAIDTYLKTKQYHYDEQQAQALHKVFYRGFSAGHLFHSDHQALVNMVRPNHMGTPLGKVISSNRQSMRVKLTDSVSHGDGIRVIQKPEDYGCMINVMYDTNHQLIKQAYAGDIVDIEKNGFVVNGANIIKSFDKALSIQVKEQLLKPTRKVGVRMQAMFQISKPAKLIIQDEEGLQVQVESELSVEEALRTPLDEARISQQLRKCGDTIYSITDLQIHCDDNASLPIKECNAMRRTAFAKLDNLRATRFPERKIMAYQRSPQTQAKQAKLSVKVSSDEQVQAALSLGVSPIYCEQDSLLKKYPQLHRIHRRVKVTPYEVHDGESISEVGGLYSQKHTVGETSWNVMNAYTVAFLHDHGVQDILLSVELQQADIASIIQAYQQRYHMMPSVGLVVYGRLELMITKYCVVSAITNHGKNKCGTCRQNQYYLKDRKGRVNPLMHDDACLTHILDEHPVHKIHELDAYINMGLTNFRLEFTLENYQETKDMIQAYQAKLIQ